MDYTLSTPNGTAIVTGTTNSSGQLTIELAGNAPDGAYTSTVTDISGGDITFEPCTDADGDMDESKITFELSGGSVINEAIVDECLA